MASAKPNRRGARVDVGPVVVILGDPQMSSVFITIII